LHSTFTGLPATTAWTVWARVSWHFVQSASTSPPTLTMGARSIAAPRPGRRGIPRPPARETGAAGRAVRECRAMDRVKAAFEDFGRMLLFAVEAVAWAFRPPFRTDLVVGQMAFIGVGSVFIVAATGLSVGMVFALQMNYALKQFAAEGYVGGSVAFSLARELAPVFTALMVTGRAGSAISTELGTMRVTEQIDAMESMAVNPIQYLVVPRIIAATLMFPVLTMVFNVIGYGGGFVMGVYVARIPIGPFVEHTREFMEPSDIMHGLLKALVFGLIVSLITTWRGYAAAGGARGVGEGTTRGVVMSSIAVLVADYVITFISVGA
jgi:phospholipid/cholesterol/gamma-HCH transport system permease protein